MRHRKNGYNPEAKFPKVQVTVRGTLLPEPPVGWDERSIVREFETVYYPNRYARASDDATLRMEWWGERGVELQKSISAANIETMTTTKFL